MFMYESDAQSAAAALYDGGWRAENKADLMNEYGLTESEAEELCKLLAEIEGTK